METTLPLASEAFATLQPDNANRAPDSTAPRTISSDVDPKEFAFTETETRAAPTNHSVQSLTTFALFQVVSHLSTPPRQTELASPLRSTVTTETLAL